MTINYIKDSNALCFSPLIKVPLINHLVRRAYIPGSEVQETKVGDLFQKDNISSNIEIGFAFH